MFSGAVLDKSGTPREGLRRPLSRPVELPRLGFRRWTTASSRAGGSGSLGAGCGRGQSRPRGHALPVDVKGYSDRGSMVCGRWPSTGDTCKDPTRDGGGKGGATRKERPRYSYARVRTECVRFPRRVVVRVVTSYSETDSTVGSS